MYIASKEGHSDLINTLLNAQADINLPCEKGEQHTPLIAATAAEQLEVVKILLKVEFAMLFLLQSVCICHAKNKTFCLASFSN